MTSGKILDGSIGTSDLADSLVTSAKLARNSVTAQHIKRFAYYFNTGAIPAGGFWILLFRLFKPYLYLKLKLTEQLQAALCLKADNH